MAQNIRNLIPNNSRCWDSDPLVTTLLVILAIYTPSNILVALLYRLELPKKYANYANTVYDQLRQASTSSSKRGI